MLSNYVCRRLQGALVRYLLVHRYTQCYRHSLLRVSHLHLTPCVCAGCTWLVWKLGLCFKGRQARGSLVSVEWHHVLKIYNTAELSA